VLAAKSSEATAVEEPEELPDIDDFEEETGE